MKLRLPFQDNTLGSMLINVGIVGGILLLLALSYFYVYLPAITNHGETITVPGLTGMKLEELKDFLARHDLRYELDDSSYSAELPPLTILRQFPREGSKVKEGRVIYVTVNRLSPPTLPLPDLTDDLSLAGADNILKSNQLRRGRVFYRPNPFLNIVLEMQYKGKVIAPGTPVEKGAVIDLVIGDGRGARRFLLGSLVGDTYERALFKLEGWNLHLGRVEIPEGVDTTGVEPVVFRQMPAADDSVDVGAPVNLWIAPPGYKPAEADN